MRGGLSSIKEILRYSNVNDNILQETYSNEDGKTKVSVEMIDKREKTKKIKKSDVLIGGSTIDWNQFVEKKIPRRLDNYNYFFPCFVSFKKSDWLNFNKPLLGITNAGLTIRRADGEYELEKSAQSLNSRNMSPLELIRSSLNNENFFQPAKDFFEAKPEPVKPEQKKSKFKIRGYDDD